MNYGTDKRPKNLPNDNFYATPDRKREKSRKRIIALCLMLCAICLALDIYFIIGILNH